MGCNLVPETPKKIRVNWHLTTTLAIPAAFHKKKCSAPQSSHPFCSYPHQQPVAVPPVSLLMHHPETWPREASGKVQAVLEPLPPAAIYKSRG